MNIWLPDMDVALPPGTEALAEEPEANSAQQVEELTGILEKERVSEDVLTSVRRRLEEIEERERMRAGPCVGLWLRFCC